jgi:UDP-glucose:(glucosyl)LPS alpha-1,2-glucosyltransferase
MSSVLSFTDVPEGTSPEEHAKQLDKKKIEEQNAELKKQQKEIDELTAKSQGGTEQMLRRLQSTVDPKLLDQFQIICSRVRWIDPDKKTILWLHDLPGDPESEHLRDPQSRARFAKIVCVSDWQMQQYNTVLGLPYKESLVLKNAIEPVDIKEKKFDGKIKLIYHTTPHRGLEILVPVFESLYEKFKDKIELDVFSSFEVYGWDERDKPFEKLFEKCKEHPGINYHGYRPREVVIEALKESHIFAFPSIWPETSCLSAIEAMSAMNLVVCPNLAALPETTNPFSYSYQYSEDRQEHANRFGSLMHQIIEDLLKDKEREGLFQSAVSQKKFVDGLYSWENRKEQWESLLTSLTK